MNVRGIQSFEPQSYWEATAGVSTPFAMLQGSQKADVAVVGAGYTGLCIALSLAQAGVTVTLLEAGQASESGASARNGGQVIASLKTDPQDLRRQWPEDAAEAILSLSRASAGAVFELVARHGIECDAVRTGWMQLAHSPHALEAMVRRAEQWEKLGSGVYLPDQAAAHRRLGGGSFCGGWVDSRSGKLHPLKYARGLARAAVAAGARIFAGSPVVELRRSREGWSLRTAAGGLVCASQVVVATNGYSGNLVPELASLLLPVHSLMLATAPLPASLRKEILPGGEAVSTTHRLVLHFRMTSDGRLAIGGRAMPGAPVAEKAYAHIEREISKLFPSLKDIGIDYRWSGRVAVTRNFLPCVYPVQPGVLFVGGYSGRGVAMSTMLGCSVADHLSRGGNAQIEALLRVTPKRFHAPSLRSAYIRMGSMAYRIADAFK